MRLQIQPTRGFSLVELLVAIAILAVIGSLLFPAIQRIREAARRSGCQNNLRQAALASINFENARMNFPPGYLWWESVNEENYSDTNIHSGNWNSTPVYTLSFMELVQLEERLVSDRAINHTGSKPWYNTSDFQVVQTRVNSFLCPSANSDDYVPIILSQGRNFISAQTEMPWTALRTTNYISCGGYPREIYGDSYLGIFTNRSKNGYGDIADGASNTLLYAEAAYMCLPWIGDGQTRARYCWNVGGKICGFGSPGTMYSYNSEHAGNLTNTAMADGSIHALTNGMDFSAWIFLCSMAEGETVHVADF